MSADPPKAYLAGPDVFLPDPHAWAARKQAICAAHGLHGVSPLDPLDAEPAAWAGLPDWQRLHRRNEAHIRGCDALIANLTPFRGPSADAGTIYELGFMRALGRPVFGYTTTAIPFTRRTLAHLGGAAAAGPDGDWFDADGMLVEAFGLHDNLMLDGALADGGALLAAECPPVERWTDLALFERCVVLAAARLRAT